ncbi:uncharacterized protein SCHCODRAFT_02669297 [Schizophyllum commune H4-8]|uniref:Expressed protein n=1 Tax=Schizophyllum commune (strain H4-8 / FGSC 9210) TaxID=578458 RepID=D8QA92_SCHCM|nr:uncharacterized protein SCHCODRAFT_02669297 [Schizophyllum commune H4-8]KAI5890098.1 hypothetical protein SCHCODRAFT_02669297 [Schizophyllum commune H4-8]
MVVKAIIKSEPPSLRAITRRSSRSRSLHTVNLLSSLFACSPSCLLPLPRHLAARPSCARPSRQHRLEPMPQGLVDSHDALPHAGSVARRLEDSEPIAFSRRHSDTFTVRPSDLQDNPKDAAPPLPTQSSSNLHSPGATRTDSSTVPLNAPRAPLSVTIAAPHVRERRPSTADKPKQGFNWKRTFTRLRSHTVGAPPLPKPAAKPALRVSIPKAPASNTPSPTSVQPATPAPAPAPESLPRPKRASRLARATELFTGFSHTSSVNRSKPTSPSLTSLRLPPGTSSTSNAKQPPPWQASPSHPPSATPDAATKGARLLKRGSISLTKLREKYVAGSSITQLRRAGSWRASGHDGDPNESRETIDEGRVAGEWRSRSGSQPQQDANGYGDGSWGRASVEQLSRSVSRNLGADTVAEVAEEEDESPSSLGQGQQQFKVARPLKGRSKSARCSVVQQPAFVGQWNSDDMSEVIRKLRSLKSDG